MSATPTAVDWFRILWDLVQHGQSLSDVSRHTGIAHGTLRRYLHGAEPAHRRGELLLAMWMQSTGQDRADAPMAEVFIAPRVVVGRPAVAVSDEACRELERVWR